MEKTQTQMEGNHNKITKHGVNHNKNTKHGVNHNKITKHGENHGKKQNQIYNKACIIDNIFIILIILYI